MLDPRGLYELEGEQPPEGEIGTPVLVHALSGFIDAGSAGRLAAAHVLETLEHHVIARFDVDQIYDYRARRPAMTFIEDHWADYADPELVLRLVRDVAGVPFLLLTGPEPDVQWERFVAAVVQLIEHHRVRLTVGIHAIPMGVPHTRPAGTTAHATQGGIIAGFEPWLGTVQVPGHVAGLLELRLGQAGRDAAGFAVHVPHYLAQAEYPDAAVALLDAVGALCGLDLPTQALREAGETTRAAIEAQLGESPDVQSVVRALEEQYDAFVRGRHRSLLAQDSPLPSADELGAELERFLAEENDRRGRGDG